MGNINPSYNDRVRYTLKNKNFETLIITEPLGWNDDEKEYARHEKYHGIIAKFSNSLKFIGSGADYIQLVLDIYGINEDVKLTREEKHPQTDVWTLTYYGYLDLSTWSTEKNQVSLKFNSGGLEQLLKSRESEKVEIDRLTTIDGKTMPPLEPIDVELQGRRIFLKSSWEAFNPANSIQLDVESDAGNTRQQSGGFPLSLINKSHEEAASVSDTARGTENYGSAGMMFFLLSEETQTINLKGRLGFRPTITSPIGDVVGNNAWAYIAVYLTVYSGGSSFIPKKRTQLYNSSDFGGRDIDKLVAASGNYASLTINQSEPLLKEESIGIELFIKADLRSGNNRHFRVLFNDFAGELTADEDSIFKTTKTKAILAHEAADRLVTIATNEKSAFYSDFLGRTDIKDAKGNPIYNINGKASFNAIAHGFWVRNFDKLPSPTEGPPKVENLFKPLTTSFKDFVESMAAVWNVGVGIEKIGFGERVRLEELSYFYNLNTTIRLPNQVKNVKRRIAVDKYYSSLEIGYKEGGDYEEANGLDEYNVKSTFTTAINRLKNTYTKVSEYRADSYGMEFTRRKQRTLNDTVDTGRDNSIWLLDLIYKGKTFTQSSVVKKLYEQRKWQDDFSISPTGVFSPSTATNLRFSPINCLLRHSWWFSGCLKKHASDFLRYASSKSNSQLKTKLRTDVPYVSNLSNTSGNGHEYSENGNIINSELQGSRFLPEEIEFEHVCDFNVMEQINGTTTILGKKIPNFYGLVEFINEKNENEKGFLLNLKPNGKGAWKILKANR